MSNEPALQTDDVLIVAEGAGRLTWHRTGPARWRPVGLWPTREQEADVAARVRRGAPLLVVLAEMPTVVPLLTEELVDAPEELLQLAEFTGYLCELTIPFLGWLPSELRERGCRFIETTRRRTPAPLTMHSPLQFERADPATPHVVFARWLRSGHPPIEDLVPMSTRLFSGESL